MIRIFQTKSDIFCLILVAFILGIALASFIKIDNFIIYFILLISLMLLFLSSNRKIKVVAILGLFFILGIWRYQLSIPRVDESKIQFYNGQKINFQGVVITEPDIRSD
ncbi:MAG: hypothetical protein ACPLYC_00570, partial [Minisyncoccia bacterium]